MNTRLQIERSILGAIIHSDGFSQVAHILSPANFSSIAMGYHKHRELYAVISEMHPHKPIDMVTILNEIRIKHPNDEDLFMTLAKDHSKIHTTSSLGYWAVILLQIDIGEKYQKQLSIWHSERLKQGDHAESGALREIYQSINPTIDIFDLIDSACEYFEQLKMEEELVFTRSFNSDVIKKARNIRKMGSINNALAFLFKITDASPQVKYECEIFAKAIAHMIITGQSKPEYTNALNLINT